MKISCLSSILCISVISHASACANSNNLPVSNLLYVVFSILCGVTGVWMLRIMNLSEILNKVNKVVVNTDLPVEFRRLVRREVALIVDRRRSLDRGSKC
jgi:hypothetical protein